MTLQFSLFQRPNEREQQQDEARLQSAMLADMGRCPVCGTVLVAIECPDCRRYQIDMSMTNNIGFCPTCGGVSAIRVCPKQGEHRQ